MSAQLTAQQQLNALVETTALGMISMLAVHGMSQFVAYGVAASASTSVGATSAQAELSELNERIRKLNFVMENYRSSVVSLRNRRAWLMKEYGLSVTPALVEMKKYPQLRMVERNLKTAEEQLARLEVKDMNLRKRRNELQRKLGIKPEELPPHTQYAVTKKFTPKTGIY